MNLDDLLGLLFLLLFVVIPALQGLLRRGQPPAPPGFPEDLPPPQPRPRPKPRTQPTRPSPPPLPPPSQEGISGERGPGLERIPHEVRFREEVEESGPRPRLGKRLVRTDGESILQGVIWHEILKKPKGW